MKKKLEALKKEIAETIRELGESPVSAQYYDIDQKGLDAALDDAVTVALASINMAFVEELNSSDDKNCPRCKSEFIHLESSREMQVSRISCTDCGFSISAEVPEEVIEQMWAAIPQGETSEVDSVSSAS